MRPQASRPTFTPRTGPNAGRTYCPAPTRALSRAMRATYRRTPRPFAGLAMLVTSAICAGLALAMHIAAPIVPLYYLLQIGFAGYSLILFICAMLRLLNEYT